MVFDSTSYGGRFKGAIPTEKKKNRQKNRVGRKYKQLCTDLNGSLLNI